MIIKSLKLKDYRNYEILNIEFDHATNIFYGDNAQGKTNILEGVKGIAINKVPIRRASELFGLTNFVFFSPEDLNIIKNGPAERRRFMDLELSQLDKVYLSDLANYNRTLNQRNRLLKDAYYRDDILDTLDVWDMQLVQYGEKIIQRRIRFIEEVNAIIGDIHHKLTGGRERISLSYEPGCGALSLEAALEKNRERDIRMKSTSVGPHRDDICFMAGGIAGAAEDSGTFAETV